MLIYPDISESDQIIYFVPENMAFYILNLAKAEFYCHHWQFRIEKLQMMS
jgi:hypothetical protein